MEEAGPRGTAGVRGEGRKEKKVGCKIIPDAVSVKSTILCYMWASLSFEDPIVISKREVLKTLHNILFAVVEVVAITIFVPF